MTSRSAALTPHAPPSPDRRPDRRLHKRGQKKVSPWFPGRTPPVFPGWYDVLVEDHRSRLYWSGGEWLMSAGPVGCPFTDALARRRFVWRGIDRSYYEIGTAGTPVRRVTARRP